MKPILWLPGWELGSNGTQSPCGITILIVLVVCFTFLICLLLRNRLDPEFAEAVLRVVANASDPILRSLDQAISLVPGDHTVIDGLQLGDVATFEDLFQTVV